MLVQLVRDRVRDPGRERRPLVAERPQQEAAEDGELGRVGELPQHEIPRPEPGAEIGHGGEREDDGGPEDDRRPEAERS